MRDSRFFVLAEARTGAPPKHVASLLQRLGLDGLSRLHGEQLEELALVANVHASAVAVLEGLVVDSNCGFVASGAWGQEAPAREAVLRDADLLARPLAEELFSFSTRARNCFERTGIRTVGELVERSDADLLQVKNLGRKTVREIHGFLSELGLGPDRVPTPHRRANRGDGPSLPTWPISSASRERLTASGLVTLETLGRQSEISLLDSELLSLDELLSLASILWVDTGVAFSPPSRVPSRLRVDLHLLCPIDDLGYPGRALSQISALHGAHRLLSVVRLGRMEVEGALDARAVTALGRALRARGLDFGRHLDARLEQYAEDLAEMFVQELACPPGDLPRFLEDELDILLSRAGDGRNARIVARRFGWDGGAGARDSQVAEEFDLSRERIRQIRDKVLVRFRNPGESTPLLEAAVDFVSTRVPAWAGDLEGDLVRAGVCRKPFRLEGILSAALERAITARFRVIEEDELRVAVGDADERKVRRLLRATRRALAGGDAGAGARAISELRGETRVVEAASPNRGQAPALPYLNPGNEAGPAFPLASSSADELAGWILQRAQERRLIPAKVPWSLAELAWGPADVEGLRHWGEAGEIDSPRELSRRTVVAGVPLTGRQAAALIFLAYAAEVGRQEAHEGELWPFVRTALGAQLRDRLFTDNGMLREWMREAIELVCPQLGLRHVFGQEGIQAWIRTVFLQFGVSEAGWERLPWWLSGHRPTVSVDDLLHEGGALYSRGFADLWRRLQTARFGHRDEARLRRELQSLASPWLTALDLGRVARAALARPDVQRLEPGQDDGGDEESRCGGLLSEPLLSWEPGSPPLFEVRLAPEAPPVVELGECVLVLDGHARRTIVAEAEGSWHLTGDPIRVELRETTIALQVLRAGAAVLSDSLNLVDADEELMLFDLRSGRRLDPWSPVPVGRGVALLARSDLTVAPEAPLWTTVFAGGWRLWRFESGVPAGTTVALGSEELWKALAKDARPRPFGGRAWYHEEVRWGEAIRVRVEMDDGVVPLILRLGSHEVPVTSSGSRYEAITTLDPTVRSTTSARVVAISKGRRAAIPVHLQLDPPWGAAVQLPAGGWRPIRAEDVLDPGDLTTARRFAVAAPTSWHVPAEELAVLEGHTFQARPRGAQRGLGTLLHGVGAPLTLGRPYNHVDAPAVLAGAVISSGLLAGAERQGDLRLQLRSVIAATEEHRAWSWRSGEQCPQPVEGDRVQWQGAECVLRDEPATTFACAIEYRGARLGARNVDGVQRHAELADVIEGARDWPRLALWLRWWRAPLLADDLAAVVHVRSAIEPVPTISAWLGNPSGLPSPLRVEGDDPGWATVVQHFFWAWRPSGLQAASLIAGLGFLTGDLRRDLHLGWTGFEPLLAVHPVLLALVARNGLPALYGRLPATEVGRMARSLRNRLAALSDDATEQDWRGARGRLLSVAAKVMGVDSGFVEHGLLKEARDLANGSQSPHDNLRVALVVGPVRTLIAAALVHDFAEGVS